MPNVGLKDHYERKYAAESAVADIQQIRTTVWPTSRFEAAVKYFPRIFRGGKVLELAAGNGSVAQALLAADPRISRYVLGEISGPRVDGLRRNVRDSRAVIREIDADHPRENEHDAYDAVIMIALIEHLIDPLRAMKEIRQLLRPEGFVYVDTPNLAKYTRRLKLVFGRFPSTASANEGLTTFSGEPVDLYDEGHLHYFTYRSLSKMLMTRCGFSTVKKLPYAGGRMPLGKYVHTTLAKGWPEMFSEIALAAYG